MKWTCMIFAEGGLDRKFLATLIPLLESYHARKWAFTYDNASGSSPKIILTQCSKIEFIDTFDLVICFIDLDKLKSDYPKTWQQEKVKLEAEYSSFFIHWQLDNLEEEFIKVLGEKCSKYGKHQLNKFARKNVAKFKNSDFWKKILKTIKDREDKL